jgi:CubicO group peptidase (beta-lactamase class C family)
VRFLQDRPRTLPELERYVGARVAGVRAPAVALAAFDREGVRWLRGFGVRDLRRGGDVDDATVFRWFSLTKLLTATTVLGLADQGKLRLEDPVIAHLPWFRVRPSHAAPTVRQLLAHAAGLADPIPARWAHPPGEATRAGEAFAREVFARHARLRYAPGTSARYTNLGYLVLEALVERATGEAFVDVARRAVLAPLGMGDTRFEPDPALAPRTATGHERLLHPRTALLAAAIPRARALVEGVRGRFVALRAFGLDGRGYGALSGSLADLVKLGRAHLRGGELDGARVLGAHTVAAMHEPQALGRGGSFGLAWWLGEDAGAARRYVHHGGAGGGYRSELRLYPREALGFAVLASAGGCDTHGLLESLAALPWT